MRFKNRFEAGKLLSEKLKKFRQEDCIVYAIPRGGVEVAYEISTKLNFPLDLVIARKISHPNNPEYAIAAVAENGHIIHEGGEIKFIDKKWLEKEVETQREEAKRRRMKYLGTGKFLSPKNKIAILVDDGVATGLTLRMAIIELKHRNPKKIIIALPVLPNSTFLKIKNVANEVVALEIPEDREFLGAIGAYYENFGQVSDERVVELIKDSKRYIINKDGNK